MLQPITNAELVHGLQVMEPILGQARLNLPALIQLQSVQDSVDQPGQ